MTSSSGAEEDDQYREARAYNNSIYLMVGMPYLSLGALGFLIWRGFRQRDRAQREAMLPPSDAGESLPCPPSSTAEGSSPAP